MEYLSCAPQYDINQGRLFTLFGLVHPGGGRPRSPRRVGGRPSLHVGSLLQSPSIFSSPPSREGLKMTPPLALFQKFI